MTDTDPRPPDPEPTAPARGPRWRGWPSRLVPAGTFLVGVALGGGVVGAAMSGDGGGRASGGGAMPSSSASPSTGAGGDSGGSTVVTVPAACSEAAGNVQHALDLLRGGTGSIEHFKPDRLVTLLNRLEDIDNETRPLLTQCSQVDVSRSPTASATVSATP